MHACGVLVCTYSDESGEGTILFFGHKTEKLVVPHKPVAAIGELAAVNHGWQSESTDGLKGGWSCVFLEWLQ